MSDENAESKYEVREVIGKGAFGEVNLVVEKQSKQRFVLKRIKMARQSEWQRKATRQEIEIVSRLRHPFIMPYKEHWTHHGHTINVVYGYCEKGDLTSAIAKQKGKCFSEETLRLWLAELLLAVDYMHRQNVLHRDIKTQNILLTGEGDVQIGDFGLSTVRVPSGSDAAQQLLPPQQPSGGDDTDPRLDSSPAHMDVGGSGAATPEPAARAHHALATAHVPASHAGAEAYTNGLANAHANGHNGHQPADKDKDQLAGLTPVHDPKTGTRNDYALVGTPHFMSPELLSSQKYSYETDIWSLGVVMYELTTLKPPFNAFNLAGLVAKIKRAALPPIPPCYSADWTAILKSMLRKDPTRRAAPLELLAVPSMQQARQQAQQRALAISPGFVMPEIPVLPDTGISSGFCFDVAVPAGGVGGLRGGAAAAAGQHTPSAATPVLLNPQANGDGGIDASGGEAETSPLSKFPDLGLVHSPLPAAPVPAAVAAAAAEPGAPLQAASAAAAAVNVGTSRCKTPSTARRPGGSGTAAPANATGAAAGGVKRATSPQRARVPPTFGGTLRSKTPGRTFGAATVKADVDPSNRNVTKVVNTARESRSKSVIRGGVAMSPRQLSGGAAAAAAEVAAPASTRPSSSPPETLDRQNAGRRAGPSSGPAPRVATLGVLRSSGNRRSLLDVPMQPAPAATATVVAPVSHEIDASASPAVSFDASAASCSGAAKLSSASSSQQQHKSSPTSGAASGATAATVAGGGANGGRVAPVRPTRCVSLSAARVSRAALAGGSSPPRVSPRGADAATGHPTAAAKRPMSAARASSTDSSSAASAAASAVNARRATVAATGQTTDLRRDGSGLEPGFAISRPRASTSPPQPLNAAPTAAALAATAAAGARRRSQPGTAGTKETADAAAGPTTFASRQPEKRVRRSSYVAYGKPAESAPLQRRPIVPMSARESAPASSAAAATVRAAAAARRSVGPPVSSHPLAASDAALDSCPPSARSSTPEDPAAAVGPLSSGVAAPAADAKAAPADESLSPRGDFSVPAAATAAASGDPVAAALAGGAANHPWRLAPRSRSLMSMTTEDSELSIPDGSGRYGPSETNGGGVYDSDLAPTEAAGFPAAVSPARGNAASSAGAGGAAMTMWNCNQLYSGSYGSVAGSLADMAPAPAGAAAGVPSGVPSAAGSARGNEQSLGGASVTLAADLPRRVSVSAFSPQLFYGGAATAALASARDAAAGTESETSTPSASARGDLRSGFRRPTLNEPSLVGVESGSVAGCGRMQLVSPTGGRFDLVASSTGGAVAESPNEMSSSTAASPHSSRYDGGGVGMEIVSPTSATARSPRGAVASAESPMRQFRRGSGSFNSNLQQRRSSGRALDGRAGALRGSNGHLLANRQSGETSYDGGSPLGSTASASQRALSQHPCLDAAAAATAAVAVADSCSEVTSQLRPVAEDVDGEAESAAVPQQRRDGGAAAATPDALSTSERAQLALLQRVVALAGSLWEMGREEELGAVLSSTLSRALVRRPGSPAAGSRTSSGVPGALQSQRSLTRSPSSSSRIPSRVPELGDAVRVTAGPLRGAEAVVRYRGPCHWGAGTVLGLELAPGTRNSSGQVLAAELATDKDAAASAPPGCLDGVRYFRCHTTGAGAAFVGADQVTVLD